MVEAWMNGIAVVTPQVQMTWRGGDELSLDDLAWPGAHEVAPPDWFDAKCHLPGIKHRYLNDTACYSLAASLSCLSRREGLGWHEALPQRRGVFVGTAVADYAVRQSADREVLAGGHGALNTVSAPNISANIAAAHVAMACQARAFSTTLASPFLSGFEGLFFAVQSLQLKRTDAVLAVAAEASLLTQGEAEQPMPGAVALHLQAGRTDKGGQRIAASCWGHVDKDAIALSPMTQRFIASLPNLLGPRHQDLQLAVLRTQDALSAAIATRWRDWLAASGIADPPSPDVVFPTVGTVAPMLQVLRCLTSPRPVLLLAIHQRRHLAFLFSPTSL